MGLIVALGPIAFQNAMPALVLKSAAREVAGTLSEARSAAIRDNREAVVVFDLDARAYRAGEGGTLHELDSGLGLELVTASSEQASEAEGRIRFYPDGTSTGGRLTLTQDERKYYVVVDWLTGRVRVQD